MPNQKQLFIGVLKKKCSENMQQIYRRTPMPKCDFNKVALQLYWNHTLAWVSPVCLLHIFTIHFPNNISGGLLFPNGLVYPLVSPLTFTWRQWHLRYFGVFIVNFEQISHIVLLFPLLTLNMYEVLLIDFKHRYFVFIVDFDQVNTDWV